MRTYNHHSNRVHKQGDYEHKIGIQKRFHQYDACFEACAMLYTIQTNS